MKPPRSDLSTSDSHTPQEGQEEAAWSRRSPAVLTDTRGAHACSHLRLRPPGGCPPVTLLRDHGAEPAETPTWHRGAVRQRHAGHCGPRPASSGTAAVTPAGSTPPAAFAVQRRR